MSATDEQRFGRRLDQLSKLKDEVESLEDELADLQQKLLQKRVQFEAMLEKEGFDEESFEELILELEIF